MPPLNEVTKLLNLSLDALPALVREEALRVSKEVEKRLVYEELYGTDEYDEVVEGDLAVDREVYLSDQVSAFKNHVLSHVPLNLMDEILAPIVLGISQAILWKKQQWSPTTHMSKFTKAMYAIVKFSNLLVVPTAQSLDLNKVPKVSKKVKQIYQNCVLKVETECNCLCLHLSRNCLFEQKKFLILTLEFQMIRTKLYNSLPIFKNLRTLILGSGSGGWVADVYSEKFAVGLPHMKYLVHVSLKYDCNSYFLNTLSCCAKTLRVLDIEQSKQVRDDSVAFIKALPNLVKLNIFRTGLTTEGEVNF